MTETIDWDDEFANAKYISNGSEYPKRWREEAAEFVCKHANAHLDYDYGPHQRQKFDLFLPSNTPKGLMVFIHGGYWLDFDKSYWSHLANGCCSRDWAVGIPTYVLAPHVLIGDITTMIGRAVETCAQHVPGPIVLVGHSAGGHLVLRLACQDSPLRTQTLRRVQRFISISGISDLSKLLQTRLNDTLQLDEAQAKIESPIHNEPLAHASILCWVGANERPEFIRQSSRLTESWSKYIDDIELVHEPNRHHFDILDSLKFPDGALTRFIIQSSDK